MAIPLYILRVFPGFGSSFGIIERVYWFFHLGYVGSGRHFVAGFRKPIAFFLLAYAIYSAYSLCRHVSAVSIKLKKVIMELIVNLL